MGMEKPDDAVKDAIVQLRMSPADKAAISKAARLRHMTLSKFVLENAVRAAQEVLAAKDWTAFCCALDAPPRVIPAVRKLLTEPNVFDEQCET